MLPDDSYGPPVEHPDNKAAFDTNTTTLVAQYDIESLERAAAVVVANPTKQQVIASLHLAWVSGAAAEYNRAMAVLQTIERWRMVRELVLGIITLVSLGLLFLDKFPFTFSVSTLGGTH